MKKILLDTNAVTRFFAGDEKVLDALARADTVHISILVLGELYAGFRAGKREKQNNEFVSRLLQKPTAVVVDGTRETAEIFGQIKDGLRKSGNPIPINDIWIASQVFETGSVLITYDTHFKAIPGLRVWDGID
jgi:tRNA(fMet)-specific endonuclease VapC